MPVPELITSSSNPLIKRIRSLEQRKTRRREGAFLLEGVQPVWRAAEAGAEIETLVVAPDLVADSFAQSLIEAQIAAGTRIAYVSAELFGRISKRQGPMGIAAVLLSELGGLEDLDAANASFILALHEIGNPGNLGTIIRSADAAGVSAVVLLGDCADPFSPTAVKASMGSLYALPIVAEASPEVFLSWATKHELTLVATSARAEIPYWGLDVDVRTILLMGSEGDGLPLNLQDSCDLAVQIPMVGSASSVNLAVATGVVLFDVLRRRPK